MARTRRLIVEASASQFGLETSRPDLLASVSISVKEVKFVVRRQSWRVSVFCPLRATSVPEAEQAYVLSLATTDKKITAFTQMWDLSARTLADTIREYIEKESLMEAVLHSVDLSKNPNMSCESLGPSGTNFILTDCSTSCCVFVLRLCCLFFSDVFVFSHGFLLGLAWAVASTNWARIMVGKPSN